MLLPQTPHRDVKLGTCSRGKDTHEATPKTSSVRSLPVRRVLTTTGNYRLEAHLGRTDEATRHWGKGGGWQIIRHSIVPPRGGKAPKNSLMNIILLLKINNEPVPKITAALARLVGISGLTSSGSMYSANAPDALANPVAAPNAASCNTLSKECPAIRAPRLPAAGRRSFAATACTGRGIRRGATAALLLSGRARNKTVWCQEENANDGVHTNQGGRDRKREASA